MSKPSATGRARIEIIEALDALAAYCVLGRAQVDPRDRARSEMAAHQIRDHGAGAWIERFEREDADLPTT